MNTTMTKAERIVYDALKAMKDARGLSFEDLATVCRAFENICAKLSTTSGRVDLMAKGVLRKDG